MKKHHRMIANEHTVRYTVTLPKETAEEIRMKHGKGNLSAGIRNLLKEKQTDAGNKQ